MKEHLKETPCLLGHTIKAFSIFINTSVKQSTLSWTKGYRCVVQAEAHLKYKLVLHPSACTAPPQPALDVCFCLQCTYFINGDVDLIIIIVLTCHCDHQYPHNTCGNIPEISKSFQNFLASSIMPFNIKRKLLQKAKY